MSNNIITDYLYISIYPYNLEINPVNSPSEQLDLTGYTNIRGKH